MNCDIIFQIRERGFTIRVEILLSFEQADAEKCCSLISEVHKICDVLHFLEICEMSGNFSNLANLYRICNVLPVSGASAERSFGRLKQIKSYTRSTTDEIRLSDLSVLNIEKEFSENFDLNSVVDTILMK